MDQDFHRQELFKHSVVSNCLRPHGLQHARLPCPLQSLRVCSNSYSSSWWCHPAISSSVVPFSSCPQSPPSIRVFSNESTLCIRWPKYWSFSFSITPSNEHPGLISFRMDWLDLLAVQGTLKSLFLSVIFPLWLTASYHHDFCEYRVGKKCSQSTLFSWK